MNLMEILKSSYRSELFTFEYEIVLAIKEAPFTIVSDTNKINNLLLIYLILNRYSYSNQQLLHCTDCLFNLL